MLTQVLSAQTRDSIKPIDSLQLRWPLHDKYGFLLADDISYYSKAAWWKPALRVNGVNLFHWSLARFLSKADWTSSGFKDWVRNFKAGPEWDRDGFGVNFSGHPHTGTLYFNVARANGYSFWGSIPYTFEGSLLWEFLGENERASINDLVLTPLGGIGLGEIFHRLSSSILNDRKRGKERVFREILSAVVNPSGAINRLTSGKMFTVTTKEVNQKAPLDIIFSIGPQYENAYRIANHYFPGESTFFVSLKIKYGDLFDPARKQPFDYFKIYGENNKTKSGFYHTTLLSDGLITGKISSPGKVFRGIFQHFDYWKNPWYSLGSVGFSAGCILNSVVGKNSFSNSSFYLGVMPVAGSSSDNDPYKIPDRSYNFSGGIRAKIEEEFIIKNRATLAFTHYLYWTHVYKGVKGNELVQLFKPSVSVRLFKNVHLAYEHELYYKNHYAGVQASFSAKRTGNRIGLQINFKDQHPGKDK